MAGDASSVVPVLLITGPLGAGKSAVTDEIFERFCAANVPIALIDLDHFGSCWPASGRWDRGLAYRNLTDVWRNYAEVGAKCAIIARTIDSRDELRHFEEAIPGARIVVCRLRTRVSTLEARLRLREQGSDVESHLADARRLALELESLGVEDFVVDNDERTVAATASEVLDRAGWAVPTSVRTLNDADQH
jgi:hypothetical protein